MYPGNTSISNNPSAGFSQPFNPLAGLPISQFNGSSQPYNSVMPPPQQHHYQQQYQHPQQIQQQTNQSLYQPDQLTSQFSEMNVAQPMKHGQSKFLSQPIAPYQSMPMSAPISNHPTGQIFNSVPLNKTLPPNAFQHPPGMSAPQPIESHQQQSGLPLNTGDALPYNQFPTSGYQSTGYPPTGAMPYTSQPTSMVPPSPMLPPSPGMAPTGQKTTTPRAMADGMPSAVEVIELDRSQRSCLFQTSTAGTLPPLVTTNFPCRDEGNCNPRFIRSSLYSVPASSDLLKTVGLPFVLAVQPFANLHPDDQPLMLCDMGPQGPIRCVRCRAYISPLFTFIDGGRRFQCALCCATTEVPADYFAHLDHTGRRVDAFQRPELCLGSYEIAATKEYCKNDQLPLPPAYIFLLDVSQTAIRSGLVNLFCSKFITEILPHLPRDDHDPSNPKCPLSIGFITYDSQLHFYSLLKPQIAVEEEFPHSSKPHMNVVADLEEVFVPSVEGFLVTADPEILTNLLSTIPNHFSQKSENGTASPDPILGPAIQAGLEALTAANRSGKLFVLHTNLPTSEAPGRLKFREDRHVIGTDREKTLIQPAGDFYTNLGKQCVEAGCSVDLFLFPNAYVDVATISEVPRLTAGNLFKYSCFQADLQGAQFIADLQRAVAQPKAFNAVMRIRTSTGIRPVSFLGNALLPNTTDVEMAAIDAHQTITTEIRHDDKLSDNDLLFIQAAILYTSVSGHRRIRVHNLSLVTSSNALDIFRLADLDCYMNWLAKSTLQASLVKSQVQILSDLTAKVAHTLAGYRRECTGGPQGATPGELVLPETIKLLPLYAQCLLKSDAIRAARNISIDDRSYIIFLLNSMSVRSSNSLLYPRISPLHTLNPEAGEQTQSDIRCSYERLNSDGAYFIENGVYAFIWLGLKLNPSWVQQVFGANDVSVLEPEKAALVRHDNALSEKVFEIVTSTIDQFTHNPPLRVIRQGDLSESWIKRFMYEDRDEAGTPSYVEYLCHIHKEVRSMLK